MPDDLKLCIVEYTDPTQAADLVRLLDVYARDPLGAGRPLDERVKQTLAAELAKRPHALSVLAYAGDEPAGLVNCFEVFSTFRCKPVVNIHDVIVDQQYRGKQIASAMLGRVEQIARERGCCKLTLEVLEANPTAMRVYRRCGFEDAAPTPGGDRTLFFEKQLDE